ncbi:MAG: TusE/DsrC/DsvC family sulfur relay protein [Deltaproteobacteria bacterium]
MGSGGTINAHGSTTRVIGGKELVFDEEGFLFNPEDWTEAIAEALAGEAGLPELTEQHWKVLRFIRNFYLQNGRAPLHKEVRKETGLKLMEIERLFAGGIRHGARRLAGLPNPKTC